MRSRKEAVSTTFMTIEHVQKRFTQVYERESDALFRFCLLRVSDREKALDITQESFTKLWRSFLLEKEVENPRALVFTIARNLIIDWYRKKKSLSLEGLSSGLGDDEREFDVGDEHATLAIEHYTEVRHVLDLLNQLPTEYREAVYLRFVEGLNPRDIALVLETSPNVVSVRITRGLAALRELLGIKGGDQNNL